MGRISRAVTRRLPLPRGVDEALDAALDRAIGVQRSTVLAYIRRAQDKNPALTPAELVERLEKRYRTSVTAIGAGAGATAAAPGVGTVASLAASVAEIAAFVEATALFTLARAEVQGYTVTDVTTRRAMVMAVLLGEAGVKALEQAGGIGSGTPWSSVLRGGVPRETVAHVNKTLATHLAARFGAEQGALVAGRALPMGVGAVVGGAGNWAVARGAVTASRRLFGAPPPYFPPRVVEARAGDVVQMPVGGPGPAVAPLPPGVPVPPPGRRR